MFKCAYGHIAEKYEDRQLIPTKIRAVETTHKVDHEKEHYEVLSTGTEIVEELPFCAKHAPLFDPLIVGAKKVYHYQLTRECDRPKKKY